MTNYERIKSLPEDKLALLLNKIKLCYPPSDLCPRSTCKGCPGQKYYWCGEIAIKLWLQSTKPGDRTLQLIFRMPKEGTKKDA